MSTPIMRLVCGSLLLVASSWPSAAPALKLSAGQHVASARLGISPVGGLTPAKVQLTLGADYEYVLALGLSPVAALGYGLNIGSTDSLLLGLGARYRYQELPWPVHLHGSLQLLGGVLFDVRSVNLPMLGGRLALGGDYFLAKQLSASLTLAYDGGATLSSRSAYYWQLGILVGVSYLL